MQKIKLPKSFGKAFSLRKKDIVHSPYFVFYKWTIERLYKDALKETLYDDFNMWGLPSNLVPNVVKFSLTESDYKKLEKLAKTWHRRYEYHGNEALTDKQWPWVTLQLAPRSVEGIDYEEGYVYVDDVWFEEKQ